MKTNWEDRKNRPVSDVIGITIPNKGNTVTPQTDTTTTSPVPTVPTVPSVPGVQDDGRPSYSGSFDQQLQEIYDRILNREKFNYDVNADPLYQAAKDQHIQGGKLAMRDAMGKAAGLTGGYGSSYGQQVGQQTYDAYLQSLQDVIPELYGLAYQKYQDEGNDLLTQAGLVGNQRDTEYGRYRDDLNDWMNERSWQHQLETEQYNRSHTEQQTAYANLVALIRASGYNPTDQELAAAGLTREAADALMKEFTRQTTPTTTSGGGGGGGGRSGGGGGGSGAPDWWNAASVEQRKAWQREWGTDPDGIWGPNTAAAYSAYNGGGSQTGGSGGNSTVTPSQAMNEYTRQLHAGDITQEEYNFLVAALWSQLGTHH